MDKLLEAKIATLRASYELRIAKLREECESAIQQLTAGITPITSVQQYVPRTYRPKGYGKGFAVSFNNKKYHVFFYGTLKKRYFYKSFTTREAAVAEAEVVIGAYGRNADEFMPKLKPQLYAVK
jgi:hypothetical protein